MGNNDNFDFGSLLTRAFRCNGGRAEASTAHYHIATLLMTVCCSFRYCEVSVVRL